MSVKLKMFFGEVKEAESAIKNGKMKINAKMDKNR